MATFKNEIRSLRAEGLVQVEDKLLRMKSKFPKTYRYKLTELGRPNSVTAATYPEMAKALSDAIDADSLRADDYTKSSGRPKLLERVGKLDWESFLNGCLPGGEGKNEIGKRMIKWLKTQEITASYSSCKERILFWLCEQKMVLKNERSFYVRYTDQAQAALLADIGLAHASPPPSPQPAGKEVAV